MKGMPRMPSVKLNPILPQHKELLFNWRNEYETYKWCRQNDILDWNNHQKWFDNLGHDKSMKMYLIGIYENNVGVCGLTNIDLVNRRAEFSLYIANEFKNSGVGTMALIELFHKGFENYGLNIIWGETFGNNPACKIFEKLGMKLEGIRRQFYFRDGKFIDAKLYSITRDEFNDRISSFS